MAYFFLLILVGKSFKILHALTFQIPAVAAAFSSFFLISMTSLKFAFTRCLWVPRKNQVKHHLYLTAIPGRERIHSQCVFLPKWIWKGKDSVRFPLPLLPTLHRSGRSDLVKNCYPLPGLCQFPHDAVCRIPSKWGVPVGLILVTRNRKGGKVTLLTLHSEFPFL